MSKVKTHLARLAPLGNATNATDFNFDRLRLSGNLIHDLIQNENCLLVHFEEFCFIVDHLMRGIQAQETTYTYLHHLSHFSGFRQTRAERYEADLHTRARYDSNSRAIGDLSLYVLKLVENGHWRENAQHMARSVARRWDGRFVDVFSNFFLRGGLHMSR